MLPRSIAADNPKIFKKSGALTEQPGHAPCWQSGGDGRPGVNVPVRANSSHTAKSPTAVVRWRHGRFRNVRQSGGEQISLAEPGVAPKTKLVASNVIVYRCLL